MTKLLYGSFIFDLQSLRECLLIMIGSYFHHDGSGLDELLFQADHPHVMSRDFSEPSRNLSFLSDHNILDIYIISSCSFREDTISPNGRSTRCHR